MRDFRPDRVLTVGLARPLLHVLPAARRCGIPILMYHEIKDGIRARLPYFETRTCPRVFESHLQYLASHGFQSVTLDEALECSSGPLSSKRVVITFDDGYRDFYTVALPLLLRYGFSATVFLISSFVGPRSRDPRQPQYMSWSEVRSAHAQGTTFGSHTVTHPDLQTLTAKAIDRELGISKQVIENGLGCSVHSFSYPNAFPKHNRLLIERVKSGLESFGYQNAVSTMIGTATSDWDRFALPRLPVNTHDDRDLFGAKIEGAYNYMRYAQLAWKRLALQDRTRIAAAGSAAQL